MTNEELENIAELDKRRTQGEWEAESRFGNGYVHISEGRQAELYSNNCHHDAKFIAACSTAVPQMIAEIRRLRGWVHVLKNANGSELKRLQSEIYDLQITKHDKDY